MKKSFLGRGTSHATLGLVQNKKENETEKDSPQMGRPMLLTPAGEFELTLAKSEK